VRSAEGRASGSCDLAKRVRLHCTVLHLPKRARYEGPPGDHFDGRRFFNPGLEERGFRDFWRWMKTRDKGFWRDLPGGPGPAPPPSVPGLRVTWVGHSTVLLQVAGLNLLTDPIWSERASPVSWAGPRRHRAPGIALDDLPPIDTLLLSHDHYDHLDRPTLRALAKHHHPVLVTPLAVGKRLRRLPWSAIHELDWWDEVSLPGSTVTAVPARHFSGRGLFDRARTLWAGYVVSSREGDVYFAGDTGGGPHFAAIARRFPALRLALLPIGAFRPRWFMGPVHLSPRDALEAFETLGASTAVAIHHSTFELADDGQDEAPDELRRLLAARNDNRGTEASPPFCILGFGKGRDVPAPEPAPR